MLVRVGKGLKSFFGELGMKSLEGKIERDNEVIVAQLCRPNS